MNQGFLARIGRAAAGALAAAACCLALPALAAPANAAEGSGAPIEVGSDGSVPAQSADGPQVTKVRVLKEGTFLEVHWNEYVDETQAVNVDNYTLTNGDTTIALRPKSDSGVTDTYYFDRDNKEVAATDWKVMQYLDPSIHIASIAYAGTIDPSKPLTLTVKGTAIKDDAGKSAKDATYANVPITSFYTKTRTTKSGIVVKSDDGVSDAALNKTAEIVDAELGLAQSNGIARAMVEHGNAVAVYGNHEMPNLLPEQRYGFDKTMYAAEGYGGYPGDGFVSSISEKNVMRTTGDPDPANNTAYTDESVLVHEFAHAIKLGGLDQMADQTLANTFYAAYAHAKQAGLWANTYSYQNSDEFFATMATIWFNVMSESGDGSYDGTRSPINTRDELKAYDPVTYDALAQIFPATTLPSPWQSTPNRFGLDMAKTQPPTYDTAEATSPDLANDEFQIMADYTPTRGDIYYLERLTSAVGGGELDMGTLWGAANDLDASLDSWNVTALDDHTFAFSSIVTDAQPERRGLAANADGTVTVAGHAFDANDPAQQWQWYANADSADPYDGYLVNVKYNKALTAEGNPYNGQTLALKAIDAHTMAWSLRDLTQSVAQKSVNGLFVKPTAALPEGAGTGDAGGNAGTGDSNGSNDNAGAGDHAGSGSNAGDANNGGNGNDSAANGAAGVNGNGGSNASGANDANDANDANGADGASALANTGASVAAVLGIAVLLAAAGAGLRSAQRRS